jgi:cation:H+ antiporter
VTTLCGLALATASPPLALLILVAGVVLVVAGAELFFDAVVHAAGRLRVSAFAVTAVISGLELENLAAGIAANAKGLGGAAAGTFLGGTTFLALGVAGLAAVIAPLEARLGGGALLWTAAAPLPLLALGLNGELGRLEGALLVVWFGVSLLGLARSGRSLLEPDQPRPGRTLLQLLGGLALLTVGGDLLGRGLRDVVSRFDVSGTLLGNTVVAASVEAEEVARVVVPARRARGDVALANVLGTIVHFVGLNAGVIALVKPLHLDAASRHLHLPVAAGATLALCALLAIRGKLGRAEGVLLLAAYAGYLAAAIAAA